MKTKPLFPIAMVLAAGLPIAARAIEAPEDDAPPPPAADAKPAAVNPAPAAPAKLESAYLGVVASGVPAALADHLGLQPGEGVVVSALMPDGPAAKAGLAAHDVITRVAGQPVGSSTELTREISRRKPGESVRLDVIHKSRASGIDVTLGARPQGLAEATPQFRPLDQLNLDGIPHELADRVRDAIQDQIGELDIDFEKGALDVARQMEEAMREMKKQLGADMPQPQLDPAPPPARGIEVQQGATIRMMDNQGSVEIKALDGSKEVTIRDKDNNIVWNGPWDTEQDKAAAPADVRNRVDRLNLDTRFDGTGLRLRQVPAPQPEGD
jgi:membrane-associated protease RseP (regulator of RpoE activity)